MLAKKLVNFFKNYKEKNFLLFVVHGNNGKDGKLHQIFDKKKKVIEIDEVFETTKLKNLLSFFKDFDILVDCIFGTGLNRKKKSFYKKIIDKINNSKKILFLLIFQVVLNVIQVKF